MIYLTKADLIAAKVKTSTVEKFCAMAQPDPKFGHAVLFIDLTVEQLAELEIETLARFVLGRYKGLAKIFNHTTSKSFQEYKKAVLTEENVTEREIRKFRHSKRYVTRQEIAEFTRERHRTRDEKIKALRQAHLVGVAKVFREMVLKLDNPDVLFQNEVSS